MPLFVAPTAMYYKNRNQYFKLSVPRKNSGRLATILNEICLN